MKKLSYYIMLLGIVFFTSCEDFLDQVPKHNLTLDKMCIRDSNRRWTPGEM